MLTVDRRSRRRALRGIGWGIAAVFLAGFKSLGDRLSSLATEARRVVIPADAGGTVVFADGAVLCRGPDRVDAFRDRCSHLGCQISREMDGLLVCPCHGSRFRLDGTVAKGPAARPLEPLRLATDETGRITVEL